MSVELPSGVTDAGEKVADVPGGRPETERPTGSAVPVTSFSATVRLPALPCGTEIDDLLSDIENPITAYLNVALPLYVGPLIDGAHDTTTV
ncbi:MAG: hypothetical protein RXS42_06605 [Nitrososphaeria archaeon]